MLYEGIGLKPPEFEVYIDEYDFGTEPPTGACLHHTHIPHASWAPAPGQPSTKWWDYGESGLSERQKYARRSQRLANVFAYYKNRYGWDRGPHLFIDDTWIWIGTPMFNTSIHAGAGNVVHHKGRIIYPISIEVIGHYEHQQWPGPVLRNVASAVCLLRRRLNTFDLVIKPGRQNDLLSYAGGLMAHRHFNKPQCPGAAITDSYIVETMTAHWNAHYSSDALQHPDGVPMPDQGRWSNAPGYTGQALRGLPETQRNMPITGVFGDPSVSLAQACRFFCQYDRYTRFDIEQVILPTLFDLAVQMQIDPGFLCAQMDLETDRLRSEYCGRPWRNPAGIGITGNPDDVVSFSSWVGESIPAWIGRILAHTCTDEELDSVEGRRQLVEFALGFRPLGQRGTVRELEHFSIAHNPAETGWASDPEYSDKLMDRWEALASI